MPLTKEDLLKLFDDFINEYGMVRDFDNYLVEKGYLVDEYDDLIDSI